VTKVFVEFEIHIPTSETPGSRICRGVAIFLIIMAND
jgi:hypothetical protein